VISHKQIESTYFESLRQSVLEGNAVTDHLVREKELATLIEKEIDALPVKMRHVFKLSRTLHLSHREIAERLDLSEATVKKHVNNALKVLRIKFSHFLSLLVFLFV
jgi:RNA polymerase sigma-70 factor (ECF subfamily)